MSDNGRIGRTLVFTDMHFGIHGNSPKYREVAVGTMEWITSLCKSRGVETAVFMGDYFDSRTVINAEALFYASQCINGLCRVVGRLYMILGNHDLYMRDATQIYSASAFEGNPNLTVVSSPVRVGDALLMPWGWGVPGNPVADLDGVKTVFCHHDFPRDFFMGGKAKASSDTSSADIYSVFGFQPGFVEAVVGNGATVFSGHVHHPEVIPVGNGSDIVIEGSPYETEYGFGDAKCGVWIVDGGKREFVENPRNVRHVEVRTSEFDEKSVSAAVAGSFARIRVDSKVSFDRLSEMQKAVERMHPFFVYNTVFDFGEDGFAGRRDTDENPLSPADGRLPVSKMEYIDREIDSMDFSSFVREVETDGEVHTEGVDRKRLKEMARTYFEAIGGGR